ncbi:flavodoxin [Aliidiomarina minuta]|uniref:Flavodoxin n=1 Tax=Aliidiomarina minuta TaxID=880057 RepID=A0A432WAJ0_9GAMM|nr:flavodoxin domain-containing protein [Aliidiomarina minuta]RUO26996.1 flavodoxin [Aliidiomarina minuta]
MTIHILVGTTSGNTEFLAQEISDHLQQQGFAPEFHDLPEYQAIAQQDCTWILCIATHGAGEYADSIAQFMQDIEQHKPDLSRLKIAIVAVGDSSYDTYCKAGQDAEQLLTQLGAEQIIPRLEIDMMIELDPEGKAMQWLKNWQDRLTS